ncbi:glutathione S-transferase 1-like [Dysidea avara]|uniref:glutathione S-transferase 1-like n=1 Tax=Dysidea avara TaxID=196820 RepID=UPI0033251848
MASYRLYYYDVRGRAENIRLLFAQAGVKYEDIRFGKEEWTAKYKSEASFGRCPFLVVDGTTKISGSANIIRYLGEKFGMAGKDEIGNALLGGTSDYLDDLIAHLTTLFFASDEEKVKLAAEFKEKTVPQMFPVLQKHVKDGHFIGSNGKLSWLDIHAFNLINDISKRFCVNLADYPELKKLVDEVGSLPNIKKWIETRPKTDA